MRRLGGEILPDVEVVEGKQKAFRGEEKSGLRVSADDKEAL
jgi:hypothetical protein